AAHLDHCRPARGQPLRGNRLPGGVRRRPRRSDPNVEEDPVTLELSNCTYGYRRWKRPVLRDFSFTLPGGLTVLLGPNGAGKSTRQNPAPPGTGRERGPPPLDGHPAGTAAYRRAVAWMPQDIVPMPTLTAREYVAYIGWLKGMDRTDAWKQARRALHRVDL